jgi:outer membrane protein assembly factor BamB
VYSLRVDPKAHRFVTVVVPDFARPAGAFSQSVERLPKNGGLDFHLELAPEGRGRTFAFAQFTDLHVEIGGRRALSAPRLATEMAAALSGWSPAFAVNTGDLANLGDVRSLKAYRRAMEAAPCPVFHVYGGHDGLEERRALGQAEDDPCTRNYEAVLGPTHYSFDWGGRHFVIYPNEDAWFAPSERRAKARWLMADLEAHSGRETVVFTHLPPPRRFLEALAGHGVIAVYFGHYHASKAYTHAGVCAFGAPPFPFGGIDTSPRGFRRSAFERGRLSSTCVAVTGRRQSRAPVVPKATRRERGPLRLLWHRELDGEIRRAAPAVVEGRVLVALCDETGGGAQGVACLDLDSGRTLWRVRTDASVKNSVAVVGDVGVAVSVTGRSVAFDLRRGRKVWRADFPGYPDRWIYASPAISGDVVCAGGKSGYGGYALGSGKRLWYVDPSGWGNTDWPDSWPCFAGPIAAEGRFILFLQRYGLVALDPATGRMLWRRRMALEYTYPNPVVTQGRLVTGTDPGVVASVDLRTGNERWRRRVTAEPHVSGLGTDGQTVALTTPSGEVLALRASSGRSLWCRRVGVEIFDVAPYRRRARSATGGPTVANAWVMVGANDGYLYLLDAETGRVGGRWGFGSPISAPPSVIGNRILVGASDGQVCCFEVRHPRFLP